jgi:hypothetical protein
MGSMWEAPPMMSSARDMAGTFSGRAQAARLALVDGAAGLIWATRENRA